MNKAVVLGTNYYIGLSIIRCLGREKIYTIAIDYTQKDTYGSKSKYLNEHIIAPNFKTEKEAYLNKLIEIAKNESENPVLYPSADPYAEFIDENLDILKEYYLIPMEKQGLWTEVMKKESLIKLAQQNDVLVPETVEIDDPNFKEKVVEMIGFPCIVKPTDSPKFVSEFRKKIFYCNNIKELEDSIERAKDKQIEVFVQRIIPGFDDHMYTFDFYVDKTGKVTHWTTCRKLRQFPINFGASVYTEQKYVKELADIGIPFIEKIGYRGFGEIEFKKDEKTGRYYLIEINTRTTNLDNLLYKSGLNFPYIQYKDMINDNLSPKVIDYDTGYVFRYFFEDRLAIRDYIRNGQLSRLEIYKSLFRKKAPAIWSISDPLPAFNYSYILIKKALNKIIK